MNRGGLVVVLALVAGLVAHPAHALARSPHAHHHHRHHHRHRAHPAAIPRSDPVKAAVLVALRYWGVEPCDGHVTIYVGTPPPNDENGGVGVSMWTSWNAGTLTENDETAPQPFLNCTLGINRAVWTSAAFEGYTAWPEFAIDVVHEWGHLLGHGHSTDTRSVMYAEPSAQEAITGSFAPGWRWADIPPTAEVSFEL